MIELFRAEQWWGTPGTIVEEAGSLRVDRWTPFAPDDHPALWRRVTDLEQEVDGWLVALRQYGPLDYDLTENVLPKGRIRGRWEGTIRDLSTVARLWSQREGGIFELAMPIVFRADIREASNVLQSNLNAVVADRGVKLTVQGYDLVPEATSLAGYLWLSARDAVKEEHRFRRCERCRGWMRVQRSDARFCSARCRNAPKEEAT